MTDSNRKFGVIFTLDYEIHGNGEGDPHELIVEPTDRMLKLFDHYGAKLTILADVGEILKFKEYYESTGDDKFSYQPIKAQLQRAITTGHDVQLHIHSSYFNSQYDGKRWKQYWPEYSLADLPYPRLDELISTGKQFLERILREVVPEYTCTVFRAANWSMMPSKNLSRSLVKNSIDIDTSVFKYGQREGRVTFNYEDAFSALLPWPADINNICKLDQDSELLEVPIYCEQRKIWDFITPNRLFRVVQASFHRHPKSDELDDGMVEKIQVPLNGGYLSKIKRLLTEKHALKMDFNQCTGKQLIKMARNIQEKYGHISGQIPVVAIGHSKIFTKGNERSLSGFLKYVNNEANPWYFAIFREFDLNQLRNVAKQKKLAAV